MELLSVVGLKKTYEKRNQVSFALNGIDLSINKGEYVSIMGASGSGKSTLLQILGGMDRASSGKYIFRGECVSDYNDSRLHLFRRNNISFVFQNFALMNYYNVEENVEVPLIAKGIEKKKRNEIVANALKQVGILDLATKNVTHISGGEQQRCAIARAIASDNELVLADEPTGALDSNTGKEIMDCFETLRREGKTILVVTHDLNIAKRADRIVYLQDGRVVQ